jgi:protein-S-isoprenylcysteine O-methyltransferase Ste14
MSKPMKKEIEVSEKEIEVSEQSHTFIERGLPYLVLQFALFGLIIGVNQLTLRWGVECGWWCNFFPLAVQIICGVFFGIFGAIIWAWGMSTLGDNLTMFPMPMDGSPLHTDGPYRFMRHPSYVGLAGMFIGGSFAFGSPIGALCAVVLLPPFFSFKSCEEERYCAALYGEAWESYKASTMAGCCICGCGGGGGGSTNALASNVESTHLN